MARNALMRALAVGHDGVEVVARPRPHAGPGEAVVAVNACGICGSDVHGLSRAAGLSGMVIGHELSGTVVELGEGTESFGVGQAVAVNPLGSCGSCAACAAGLPFRCDAVPNIGVSTAGGFAEEVLVPSRQLHALPGGIEVEVGAHGEPLAVALGAVRLGAPPPGQDALVFGVGTIGLCVVAALRAAGAGRIVAVGRAPGRRRAAAALGADVVLDGRVDDVVGWSRAAGASFASAYECSGAPGSIRAISQTAALGATIVEVALSREPDPVDLLELVHRGLRLSGSCAFSNEDYEQSIALLASGAIDLSPLVSERVALAEAPGAFHRLEDPGELVGVLVQPWR